MSNLIEAIESVRKTAKLTFPVPRLPVIRLWALKEHYPEAPWIKRYDGPFKVSLYAKDHFQFTPDSRGASTWTTAETTDFVLMRKADEPVEGWIYVSLTADGPPLFTVFAYDNGHPDDGKREVGTLFGKYTADKARPEPFPDGSDNYATDMSDYQGLWLWLYHLYAPVS